MVEVTVTPRSSLADCPVRVHVRGLSPSQLVTLRAWLRDEHGERFQARAFFRAVRGALFLPPGPGPFPGVVDLFGGAGGLIEFRAGLLASRGFAVLALAFFAYDDLPRTLSQLDMEYFEEATTVLLQHPKVQGPGLGVIGISKGAEVALAMATFLPQGVATVWINGTGLGTAFLHGNPLVYKDISLPAIPYGLERVLITEMGALDNSAVFGDPQDPTHRSSAIPVEKIKGKVLFVVGEADRSLNSKLFARLAMAQMPPEQSHLLSYPGAGHLIEPPCSPLCSISSIRSSPLPLLWGGEVKPHAEAQEHSWKEIIRFLEKHLGCATQKL
ncbi:PREDICTED: LOW QUALITY PROTEIN: acyl-coenzyme A amino acid N-acyltransferase 2-like [Nestor notabilis]|uniref:LOW QUALITY PROTEIN: acyl-coenzyme A amino acid N-acyltransferase 2-like n=1 Tax=Nestor notabilis TaxID=176057 RepID=UPI000523E01F|nr:PREDICTED: LOW QUALITY PROTEIN: acyl-coenzyme A amino acid N-acyltransferase 2-like [Nestor notabilis]